MTKKVSNKALQELDGVDNSEKALAKAVELIDSLLKTDESWAPSGKQFQDGTAGSERWAPKGSQATNTTKNIEPSVGPKPKKKSSMGGNPEAKRAVPEDENEGGYDELDDEVDEGPAGTAKIKRARNKAKTKVETISAQLQRSLCEHNLIKGQCPDCGHIHGDSGTSPTEMSEGDFNGNEEGDYDENGDDYDDDDGYSDGDDMDPGLAQIVMELQRNPQLVEVLSAVLSGGSSVQDQSQDYGGGQDDNDDDVYRSASQYINDLEKAYMEDERAPEIAEGLEISPILEALIDRNNEAFGLVLAKIDKSQKLTVTLSKRINVLEEALAKSLTVQGAMLKSLTTRTEEPVQKAIVQESLHFPSPGFIQAAPPTPGHEAPLVKSVATHVLNDMAREGDQHSVNLLGFLDVPRGMEFLKNKFNIAQWKKYDEYLSNA